MMVGPPWSTKAVVAHKTPESCTFTLALENAKALVVQTGSRTHKARGNS